MERQAQHAGLLAHHRHTNHRLLVERLDPAEGFIEFFLATRDLWRPQLHALRFSAEAEFVLIKVIAGSNLEADFDGSRIKRLRCRAKSQRRRQKTLGASGKRKQEGKQEKQASDHVQA